MTDLMAFIDQRPCEMCGAPNCSATVLGDEDFGKRVDLCDHHYNEYVLRKQREMREERKQKNGGKG